MISVISTCTTIATKASPEGIRSYIEITVVVVFSGEDIHATLNERCF